LEFVIFELGLWVNVLLLGLGLRFGFGFWVRLGLRLFFLLVLRYVFYNLRLEIYGLWFNVLLFTFWPFFWTLGFGLGSCFFNMVHSLAFEI